MKENNYQSSHATSVGIKVVFDEVKSYRVKYVEELKATASRRLELLRRCKEEMEISVRDFEENINPYLEAADYHPVTQTPKAMESLIDELARELGGQAEEEEKSA